MNAPFVGSPCGELLEAIKAATTVRDIADDAGVNVSLISRYFACKEGLFEACLTEAVDELGRVAGAYRA